MLAIDKTVRVVEGCRPDALPEEILFSAEPLILKGLVADWPIVRAASHSAETAIGYLLQFYSGDSMFASVGPPDINGRVFYNEDLTGFNYKRVNLKLNEFFNELLEHKDDSMPPMFYMDSTYVDKWLPGLRAENDLALENYNPLVSIWMGNRSRVAAHYDVPANIACVAVGRRRFTLFPPEQLDNLYVGPVHLTPAGLPISLVDFDKPDFERFPKFREALKSAQVAELEPGDALFLPSMWWHHVESLESVNVLINYWWRTTPQYMGAPRDVLQCALLGLRSLPADQRKVWQHIFDYYVFNPQEGALDHIPEHARGALDGIDDVSARQIRALLLNNLTQ